MAYEIAKLNADAKVVVADPFCPETFHNSAESVVKSMTDRQKMRREEFDKLGDISQAPMADIKALHKKLTEDDDALKDYSKNLREALLELSGFKAVEVQMKGTGTRIDPLSVRGKLEEMDRVLKDAIDAQKIPEATFKRVIMLDCSESVWKKLSSYIAKAGIKTGVYAVLSRPSHIERINKVIDAVKVEQTAADEAMNNV